MEIAPITLVYTLRTNVGRFHTIAENTTEAARAFVGHITSSGLSTTLERWKMSNVCVTRFQHWFSISLQLPCGKNLPIACGLFPTLVSPARQFTAEFQTSPRFRRALLKIDEDSYEIVFRRSSPRNLRRMVWQSDVEWDVYESHQSFPNRGALMRSSRQAFREESYLMHSFISLQQLDVGWCDALGVDLV